MDIVKILIELYVGILKQMKVRWTLTVGPDNQTGCDVDYHITKLIEELSKVWEQEK